MSVIHLSIHMQKRCAGGHGYKAIFSGQEWASLKSNTRALIRPLKQRNIPTVFCAYIPGIEFFGAWGKVEQGRRDWLLGEGRGWAIDFPLRDDSLLAINGYWSAYNNPLLMAYFEEQNIETGILSGWSDTIDDADNFCVPATAKGLRVAGRKAIIAAEATNAALDRSHRPAYTLQERQAAYKPRGIDVLPIADIVKSLDALSPRLPKAEMLPRKALASQPQI